MGLRKLIPFLLMMTLTACAGTQSKPAGGSAPATDGAYSQSPAPATTPAPAPATATPAPATTPAPSSAPAGGAVKGTFAFKDKLATLDLLTGTVTGLAAPAAGKGYQAWLINDDATRAISLGMLKLRPDGSAALEWASPSSENLVARYAVLRITLEPEAGSPQPGTTVIAQGGLAPETRTAARRLYALNQGQPATPNSTAYALGMLSQTEVAVQHVVNAVNSAAIGSLPGARAHLEHVINILGGKHGDHDGNGGAENPGDGFGVRAYAEQAAALTGNQAEVAAAAKQVQAQVEAIQQGALEIIKMNDAKAAQPKLQALKAAADKLEKEAAASLYKAAQFLLTFELKAAS